MASHCPQNPRPQDLQAAISKASELRALHNALLHSQLNGNSNTSSPVVSRLVASVSSPSMLKTSTPAVITEDYPVFTPSYEDDHLPGYPNLPPENRTPSQSWRGKEDKEFGISSRIANRNLTMNGGRSICSPIEHFSNRNLSKNHYFVKQTTPAVDTLKSLSNRTGSGEYSHFRACNSGTPAAFNRVDEDYQTNIKNWITTDPPQYRHQNVRMQTKSKGAILSWLFPKSRKKTKPETSPNKIEPENLSQLLRDWGVLSMETLKREVQEANENRDAALAEVSEMRGLLGELQHKLVSLETYCQELKKALKQTMRSKNSQVLDKPNLSRKIKAVNGLNDDPIPVSHEVMIEGFLQVVSEARLSTKQFCKTLIGHIGESNDELLAKLNSLLEPHHITAGNKFSKPLLYHLEALVNQSLYQDFENCVFRNNGVPKSLDPRNNCKENFSSFVALRNLSWNDVLQKGTKYYSEDFSDFCDQKMSCIVSMLNWSKPWPEQLLQCFFVAAKCLWLLHLLAFSFSPPLMILRVDENCEFDPVYMEDVLLHKNNVVQDAKRVGVMVMPGFYVQDRVLRCRVLCRS